MNFLEPKSQFLNEFPALIFQEGKSLSYDTSETSTANIKNRIQR